MATHYEHLRLTQFADVSASTIVVYDFFLTLNLESRLVWHKDWTLAKYLFVVIRYYSLFVIAFNTAALFSAHVTVHVSTIWIRWQCFTGLFAFMLSECILSLRIYAMYARSKRILALLCVCFAGSIITVSAIFGVALRHEFGKAWSIPDVPFMYCSFSNIWGQFYAFWIPLLGFELLLLILVLIKGYESLRRRLSARLTGYRVSPLDILVKDSIMYFVVVFTTYLINFIFWTTLPTSISEVPIGFALAMSSVMSERLLLNIRDRYDPELTSTIKAQSSVLDL